MPNRDPNLEAIDPPTGIIVYVCPTENCRDHYADPDFRPDRSDITKPTLRRNQDGTKVDGPSRIECPSCRLLGKKVERVPYLVASVIPLEKVIQAAKQ